MRKYDAIGVSVAVVKDSTIVYLQSFGLKDREGSIPLHTDDLFRIASVSKTFIGTAIMQLVEKGKLSLDDDVNNYLDFKITNPRHAEVPITIKMLMCHRSSINDSQGWLSFDKINPDLNPNYTNCYCEYVPGEDYTYSNLNYCLLGAVIEIVSKERFDQYIQNHIMKPLALHGSFNGQDLDSTRFVNPYRHRKQIDSLLLINNVYQPGTRKVKGYELGYSTTIFSPSGGMIITPAELAQYMLMHIYHGHYKNVSIITKQSEQAMREIQTPKRHYALSLKHYANIIPKEKMIGQTGGAHGIHTAMIFNPEKKYGFIVFCNGCKSKSTDGHEMNYEIIKRLYDSIIR